MVAGCLPAGRQARFLLTGEEVCAGKQLIASFRPDAIGWCFVEGISGSGFVLLFMVGGIRNDGSRRLFRGEQAGRRFAPA